MKEQLKESKLKADALEADRQIKRLRKLENTFLATSAYSSANLVYRTEELKRKGAEKWEINLVQALTDKRRQSAEKITKYLKYISKHAHQNKRARACNYEKRWNVQKMKWEYQVEETENSFTDYAKTHPHTKPAETPKTKGD